MTVISETHCCEGGLFFMGTGLSGLPACVPTPWVTFTAPRVLSSEEDTDPGKDTAFSLPLKGGGRLGLWASGALASGLRAHRALSAALRLCAVPFPPRHAGLQCVCTPWPTLRTALSSATASSLCPSASAGWSWPPVAVAAAALAKVAPGCDVKAMCG